MYEGLDGEAGHYTDKLLVTFHCDVSVFVEEGRQVYGRKEDPFGRTVFREDGHHKRAIWYPAVNSKWCDLLRSSQVRERSNHSKGDGKQKKFSCRQDSGDDPSAAVFCGAAGWQWVGM
eukprot:335240-Hanusia_phi.AAC.1